MNVRLNVASAMREEIQTRGGQQGDALRLKILAAHERGADPVEIERLQYEYRHLPLTPRRPKARGSASVASDPSREIEARLWTWSPIWTSLRSDGGGSALIQIERHAFDSWLRTDPHPPVLLDHEVRVGHFVQLRADDEGLVGVAVIDDTPAGRLVLRGAEDGEVRHFSAQFLIREERDDPVMVDGQAVRVVTESSIREAGPCLSPADLAAQILKVRSVVPTWKRVAEARERDRQMRHLRRPTFEGPRSW